MKVKILCEEESSEEFWLLVRTAHKLAIEWERLVEIFSKE